MVQQMLKHQSPSGWLGVRHLACLSAASPARRATEGCSKGDLHPVVADLPTGSLGLLPCRRACDENGIGVVYVHEDAPIDRFAENAAQLAARAGPITTAEAPATEQTPRERNAPAPQTPRPPGAGRVLQSSSSDPTKPLPVPDEATLNDARIAARQAGSLAELRGVEGVGSGVAGREGAFC